ncbi:cell division protein FtsX [Alterisphingorhabdus coralli]|uniref:Cell division protein n=1 Tax=Alterisphingorhabdus coralli TaxID=3071408 RepID=A0AA97F6R4_9SPHN|nr:FtsX-like permease family protein [Parasphingorhabdus sp. SCSIO 66989]WOE75434.1 cell division protein [Parasphingorhabdus sp. SCSIO 66989]
MPWVIAIMIVFTLLAVASGLALRSAAQGMNAELAGRVTVQIVAADPVQQQAERQAAEKILDGLDIVDRRKTLSDAEVDDLLTPWLGEQDMADTITIPTMIDLDLVGTADEAALGTLREALGEEAPSARIDAHGAWLRPVFDLLQSLQILVGLLVLLLVIAMVAAVMLSVRSALNTHGDTINVMHLLGATDVQVARLFQRRVALDAAFGSLVGAGIAALLLLLLGQQVMQLDAGLLNAGQLQWMDLVVLALVPIAVIALTIITARITVLVALKKTL